MIELTGSSFLATLVQTSVFLLSLPADVLTDTTGRRRLIFTVQTVYTGGAFVLTEMSGQDCESD